jgi:hypothetical protein
VDFTSPVLVDDVPFDAPRRAARPSAQTSTSGRAKAGIREIIGVLAIFTLAFTVTGDRKRRRMTVPEQNPHMAAIAASGETTPAAPSSSPPETALREPPTFSPDAAAPAEAATPDGSSPVAARTAAPPVPRASVLHRKPHVATTTANGLSKPKWLLHPANVDNPY